MRNSLMIITMALLSACAPDKDAVWLFTVGETTFNDLTVSCAENLITAECPADTDPEQSPWTYTDDREQSPAAFFGQVLDAPDGQKVLIVDGSVYIGEKSDGAWRFTWTNSEEGSERAEHQSSYIYGKDVVNRRVTTIVFDPSGKTATGSIFQEDTVNETVYETDQWLSDEVGYSFGRLFDDAPVALEGDTENFNDVQDCSSEPCEIQVTGTSSSETTFTAIRTVAGKGDYTDVFDAGQDAGT